jgi:hypothetical protein
MGRLVKLIGSGIGLASEAMAQRKAQNAATNANPSESSSSAAVSRAPIPDDVPPQYVEVSDEQADRLIEKGQAIPVDSKDELRAVQQQHEEADDDATSEEGDEEHWELDDAVEAQTPSEDEGAQQTEQHIVDTFMRNHPPPAYSVPVRAQLPCPVIIPQRRPRDKKRGFVRAYAPVLEDCGIDQATFLEFLKSFHQASKASPWLQVVNMAAASAGFVPNPIAVGVSIAVQFAVGVAMEVQRRTRFVNRPHLLLNPKLANKLTGYDTQNK